MLLLRQAVAIVTFALPATASAQSPQLLERVRIHAPDARGLAEAELAACEKDRCEDRRRLAFLAGYLALSAGDVEAATRLLTRGAPEGLEAWHRFYSGQAAFYARDHRRAAALFEEAAKIGPSSLRIRATARLGEALLAAGDAGSARAALEQAAADAARPELLHQRALARDAVGETKLALEDRIRLAIRFPAHPYGEAAAEALGRMKPPRRFRFEERLTRARAFLGSGDGPRALEELRVADARLSPADRARAARARAEILFALGRDAEANLQVEKAQRGPRDIAAEATMVRARFHFKTSGRAVARDAMAQVAERFSASAPADEAHFLVGWLELQMGKHADAVRTFSTFQRQRSGSARLDEVLWFKALAQLRQEDHPGVVATLEELQRKAPRSSLVPQAKYWATRAAQMGGAAPEAIAPRYEEIVALFPASFYALLAQSRLTELGRTPPARFPAGCAAPAIDPPAELLGASALSRAGLFRDAELEVEAQLSAVRKPSEALRFGHALQRLGEFGSAHQLAARLLWGAAFGEKDPAAVALFYPRAFQATVEDAARAHSIPPELIWATMRRESGFRAEVTSAANARGLMQLLPTTSTAIARALGQPAPDPDALFSPEINIRFGAWYLAQLWKRFGHPALVAAAYNAGPISASQWANGDHPVSLDLFVELIPYKETRGYVKQVVSDFHLYGALYGRTSPQPLVMTVPRASAEGVNF